MEKIKSKIIRLFGGKTKEDTANTKEDTANAFLLGRRSVLVALKLKMKELYGKDADEWCKEVYSLVERLSENNNMFFNKKYNH